MPPPDARVDALRLLKVRPRTEAELRQRLSRKGHDPSLQEQVVQDLKRKGLLDDARFARLYVAQRMHSKPLGRRLLERELKSKGVDADLAARAMAEEALGPSDLELARGLADKRLTRLKGLPEDVRRRRLFGFLSRRGFSGDVVYQVMREVTAEGRHPPIESGAGSLESEDRIPPFGGMTE